MKRRRLIALQLLIIIAVTTIAFSPSLRNGFTNWDDPELLLKNESVKSLSPANLRAMFSQSYAGFGGYTPLVLLSYAVENRLFGLDPKVFHLDNLILHVLNTILIYVLIVLVSGNLWAGSIAALLFGVHPLHVEAVAWVQGRKDLLFSFFFLAASISYLLHLRRKDGKGPFYLLALVFFGCSLFSKVAAISFPLVSLLLESHERQVLDKKALRRLLPFLALAAAFLVLSFLTMRSSAYGIPTSKVPRSYIQNLGLFFYAFVFYIGKIFVPLRLTARYPAEIGGYPTDLLLNGAVFAVACVLLYLAYRRYREPVRFGVAFFILTLMPTLPFHFAGQPYADRYAYIPLAGILLILAEILTASRPEPHSARRLAVPIKAAGVVIVVILFGARTQALSRIWHDSISLWTHVLRYDQRSTLAYLNRSQVYLDSNKLDLAQADVERGLAYDPKNPKLLLNRGAILFLKGDYAAAITVFDRCVAVNPKFTAGYFNRGLTWGKLREFGKEVEDMTTAIGLEPGFAPAYYYRGLAFKEMGQPDRALADFKAAYSLGPNEALRRRIEALAGQRTQ